MRAFVTGASGFIGSYLVKCLVDDGHDVVCLKRPTSDLSNLDDYKDSVQWIEDLKDLPASFHSSPPDIIYNLAWDGVSSEDRVVWEKQVGNIAIQQVLLNLALEVGCKKFVGVGSQSEYGDFEDKVDENYPVNPKTAYAAVKVACFTIMKSFCEINGIEWYWFRLFPVFGPHESDRWLIPSLVKNILNQHPMDLTPGEQRLPYLYVGECAKAIEMAITVDGKSGIYNICSDNPTPLKNLVIKIRDRVNPSFQLDFGALPYRYGQSMYMEGDTSALGHNIYKLDTSSFDRRLEETIDYYIDLYTNDGCK